MKGPPREGGGPRGKERAAAKRAEYFTFVWTRGLLVAMATGRSSDRLPPSRPRGSASPESQSWPEINIDDGRIDQSGLEDSACGLLLQDLKTRWIFRIAAPARAARKNVTVCSR